jgi:hypothetical protein
MRTHIATRWQPPAAAHVRLDRYAVAVVVCIPAVVAYNWWIIVPLRHGLLTSVNSFFSDLEVTGARDADLFGRLDVIAGTLFTAALLLSHRGDRERRAEWRLFLTFAIAAGAGGLFPFSCAEGTDSACRTAEWHLQLPAHHYAHVLLSAVEFLAATAALLLAWRRTRRSDSHTAEARAFRWLTAIVIVGYAPLAIAYFTDRYAAVVEPVYFLAFSLAAFTEVATSGYSGESRRRRPGRRAGAATNAVSCLDRGRR